MEEIKHSQLIGDRSLHSFVCRGVQSKEGREPLSTWQTPTLAFKLVFHILARLLDQEQRQLFR